MTNPHNLKFPEPIGLWKWAARNSCRPDGKPLSMADFYARAIDATRWNKRGGETHEAYVKRALYAALRHIVVIGGNAPDWVKDALAGEIGQK